MSLFLEREREQSLNELEVHSRGSNEQTGLLSLVLPLRHCGALWNMFLSGVHIHIIARNLQTFTLATCIKCSPIIVHSCACICIQCEVICWRWSLSPVHTSHTARHRKTLPRVILWYMRVNYMQEYPTMKTWYPRCYCKLLFLVSRRTCKFDHMYNGWALSCCLFGLLRRAPYERLKLLIPRVGPIVFCYDCAARYCKCSFYLTSLS